MKVQPTNEEHELKKEENYLRLIVKFSSGGIEGLAVN